jgi:hypothetical protein
MMREDHSSLPVLFHEHHRERAQGSPPTATWEQLEKFYEEEEGSANAKVAAIAALDDANPNILHAKSHNASVCGAPFFCWPIVSELLMPEPQLWKGISLMRKSAKPTGRSS